jgi:ADP-heptose:LPS heptosyltransferase
MAEDKLKRYLVIRLGAFGDCLIVSPLLHFLKQQKHEVYILTSEQGEQIFKYNPNIDKLIPHKRNSVPNDKLGDYFKSIKETYECEEMINLCESIEVNLALYPTDPRYKYTKPELYQECNKNYYDETFKIAGFPDQTGWLPEMYFSKEEEKTIQGFFKQFKDWYVVLWGLSGSARNKTYPYVHDIINELLKRYSDMIFITVGDEACQILETPLRDNRVIKKSGIWSIRESMLACKYASLVVSPDTGILHASGCFTTPKIGLLTHSTIENITKHFKNDYSLEVEGVSCAPCFKIQYKPSVQCNLAEDNLTPLCMKFGILPERLLKQIERVKNNG